MYQNMLLKYILALSEKRIKNILWVLVSLNIFGEKISFEFIDLTKKNPESRFVFHIGVSVSSLFRTVLVFPNYPKVTL